MTVEELVRAFPVDRVWPVKQLDFCAVADADQIVVAANSRVLALNPLGRSSAIAVSLLDHERPRRHYDCQFRIARDVPRFHSGISYSLVNR